jgi:cell division protein FtsL
VPGMRTGTAENMYKDSNLAYALRSAEEQQVNKKQNEPIIRRHPKSEAAVHKRQARRMGIAIFYVVILSAALIYGKVKLTEENALLEETKSQYETLTDEYTRLEAQASELVSLKSIEQKATEEYGMTEEKPSQVVNIVVSNDNEVEVTEKQENIFDKIEEWFLQIKEYIVG